MQTGMKGAPEA